MQGESPLNDTTAAATAAMHKLHRHALESVFAFCRLCELATVSAVTREWQAAARSMAPLGWRLHGCRIARLKQLCHSSLRRHVTFLEIHNSYGIASSPDCLQLVSQRLPHLRGLTVTARLPLPSGETLEFPPGLRSLMLVLQLTGGSGKDEGFAALFNTALDAIANLAQLEDLKLHVRGPSHNGEFPGSLAALTRAPGLRHLNLALGGFQVPRLSDAHVADLRTLKQLQSLVFHQVDTTLLRRLLAPPHALQWQELGGLWVVTEADAALLVTLPLRTLDARLAMPHADFLLQLPQLQSLKLSAAAGGFSNSEHVLQAVGTCAQLRSLTVEDGARVNMLHFSSAQLGACLARLPNLQELFLSGAAELTTLAFLAEGSVRGTLVLLYLRGFSRRLPLSELQFVLQLRGLHSLTFVDVFDAPLRGEDKRLLTPPTQSPLLPHLTYFSHGWNAPRSEDRD